MSCQWTGDGRWILGRDFDGWEELIGWENGNTHVCICFMESSVGEGMMLKVRGVIIF